MKKLIILFLCVTLAFSCSFLAFSQPSASKGETSASKQNALSVRSIRQTGAGADYVSFKWESAPGASKYIVYILNEKSKEYGFVAETAETAVTVNGLEEGKTYRFKIQPVSINGKGESVGDLSKELAAVTAPVKVGSVTCDGIGLNSVKLKWSKASAANAYRVYVYDIKTEKYALFGETVKTSLTVTGLEENRLYTFSVQSIHRDENFEADGQMSEPFSEFTNKKGLPVTNAQAVQRYNEAVNSVKAQENVTVNYTKQITTNFVSCSKRQLSRTVANQLSLLDGEIGGTYVFRSGYSGGVYINTLIQPYGKQATLKGSDIKKFSAKTKDGVTTLSLTLKKESAAYKNKTTYEPTVNSRAVSGIKLENVVIKPMKLIKATQTFTNTVLTVKIKDDIPVSLEIKCPVSVKANCKVATLSFNTTVKYEITEKYKFSQ